MWSLETPHCQLPPAGGGGGGGSDLPHPGVHPGRLLWNQSHPWASWWGQPCEFF